MTTRHGRHRINPDSKSAANNQTRSKLPPPPSARLVCAPDAEVEVGAVVASVAGVGVADGTGAGVVSGVGAGVTVAVGTGVALGVGVGVADTVGVEAPVLAPVSLLTANADERQTSALLLYKIGNIPEIKALKNDDIRARATPSVSNHNAPNITPRCGTEN